MKLTKEQKDELALKLDCPWGTVALLCDGFRIDLQVQRYSGLAYRVTTYVNGEWQGKWASGKTEYPEQKFLNKRTHRAFSPKFIRDMEKIFGKRAVAKDPKYKRTFVTYDISWPSGKAAISHLCRVCESVEIVSVAEVTP